VKQKQHHGYTLVELLIVITIIAVLAGIAVPKFARNATRSKEATLRANLILLRTAADRAEADTGVTVRVDDLDNPTAPASGWVRGSIGTNWSSKSIDADTWKGPYLTSIPINPFTGNNTYAGGVTSSTTTAWTHFSNQTFNSSYIYYPSTNLGCDGKPFREW
jgi:prepilin-type N-terminal cleavage/methylation domain-containing protein